MTSIFEGLRKEDFVCTFESKGSSFLFEDIVAAYYMTEENLILSDGRKMPVFVSRPALEKMRKVGEARTYEETSRTVASLSGLVDKAWDDAEKYATLSKLTKRDVSNIFTLLEVICKEYSYFEPYYWDGAYEMAKTDADMKKSIALVQDFKNEVRAQLNPVFFEKHGLLGVLTNKISKQFGVAEDDVLHYRIKEAVALFNNKKVSADVIAARRAGYAFYMDPGHTIHLLAGDDAQNFMKVFQTEISGRGSVIKGRTAHGMGDIVRGKVCIVSRDYADHAATKRSIARMEEGDILVSETTDPEMMVALKKAAAIITDVGGMLSHAAITSRELDTPCIVGTGNASKVLRDGDMVEVDAGEGTLKLLK